MFFLNEISVIKGRHDTQHNGIQYNDTQQDS